MNKLAQYIVVTIVVAVIAIILWYFKQIIAYILLASVFSLIGRPIVWLLDSIKMKRFYLPRWFNALLALFFILGIFTVFLIIFIPLVTQEANELSNADINQLVERLEEPLAKADHFFLEMNVDDGKYNSITEYVSDKLSSILDISVITSLLTTIASILGDIFIGIFAISFISFFFLKDENLFVNAILALVPAKHEEPAIHALSSAKKLLMRYFLGIGGQVTAIIILITIGLTIVGLGFHRSLVIGLFVGILNIIPYVGPFIGAIFGIVIGTATFIELEFSMLLPKILYMAIVFLSVQVMDNIFFQPLIYGNSVNAHPLEIFIVIMMAGSLAGIPGMILAIPSYTIFRVFAREFLYKFKVIKKITEKMP